MAKRSYHTTRKYRKKKRGKKQSNKRKTYKRRKGERKSKRKKHGGTCDNRITWTNERELQQLLTEYIQNNNTRKFIIEFEEPYDDEGERLPDGGIIINEAFYPDVAMMDDNNMEFYSFESVRQDNEGNPAISITMVFEDFLDGTFKIKRENDNNWWRYIGNSGYQALRQQSV